MIYPDIWDSMDIDSIPYIVWYINHRKNNSFNHWIPYINQTIGKTNRFYWDWMFMWGKKQNCGQIFVHLVTLLESWLGFGKHPNKAELFKLVWLVVWKAWAQKPVRGRSRGLIFGWFDPKDVRHRCPAMFRIPVQTCLVMPRYRFKDNGGGQSTGVESECRHRQGHTWQWTS